MRKSMGLGTLFAVLALGLPLAAQDHDASSILTGISPDQIHLDKDAYRQMIRNYDRSQIITPPAMPNSSSSFLSKLPRISFPSWVPLIGKKTPPPLVRQPRRQPRTTSNQ